MDYRKRWKIIDDLGPGGGQGKVYRVLDTSKFNVKKEVIPALKNSIISFTTSQTEETMKAMFELFRKPVVHIMTMENLYNYGALKVLHDPKDARDAELAETRIKLEIDAMVKVTHPNLLKILDADPDSKWFVSQFYPQGSLDKYLKKFAGDFIGALRAFRPLVEGVSEIHKKSFVHRDIKPQNIFLDGDDNLILGDFGLIFFVDSEHTRISHTFENVGSRDWMPPWAYSIQVEEVKPTFDVFSLAKVLWSMVSGLPVLRLWYFNNDRFNLEKIFPKSLCIQFANELFKKCIVEHEKDCLPNATALLEEVDKILSIINYNADLLDPQIERRCKVCGIGNYRLDIDFNDQEKIFTFGLRSPYYKMKMFLCDHCGNVQLFAFDNRKDMPPAWGKSLDFRGKRSH